jgi:hypothetical protein
MPRFEKNVPVHSNSIRDPRKNTHIKHTYVRTFTNLTYMNTRMPAYLHASVRACLRHMHMHTCTNSRTQAHKHTHTRIFTDLRTQIHTCKHTYTHTHTHKKVRSRFCIPSRYRCKQHSQNFFLDVSDLSCTSGRPIPQTWCGTALSCPLGSASGCP